MIQKALASQLGAHKEGGVSQVGKSRESIQVHRPPCAETDKRGAVGEHEVWQDLGPPIGELARDEKPVRKRGGAGSNL